MMIRPGDEDAGEVTPYDVPRGTCPVCGGSEVRHLVIGLPADPEPMTGTPPWIEWVGCLHPGYDRNCDRCGAQWESEELMNIDSVWPRIVQHAGQTFKTSTGLEFTYRVPGQFLRVTRDGREINRSLSRTNFARALEAMPVDRPGDISDCQGPAYTWAILMDPRVRRHDW